MRSAPPRACRASASMRVSCTPFRLSSGRAGLTPRFPPSPRAIPRRAKQALRRAAAWRVTRWARERPRPMPSLRRTWEESGDIASYLMTLKQEDPKSYAPAPYLNDPKLKAEGEKVVRRYGCAGCHEIAGMESEGRIGTELTVEGSKP